MDNFKLSKSLEILDKTATDLQLSKDNKDSVAKVADALGECISIHKHSSKSSFALSIKVNIAGLLVRFVRTIIKRF